MINAASADTFGFDCVCLIKGLLWGWCGDKSKTYEGMSDEQIRGMLEDRMCDYCPLPDELKGAHCYGDAPVMCEGTHCAEAIAAWKEEFVE